MGEGMQILRFFHGDQKDSAMRQKTDFAMRQKTYPNYLVAKDPVRKSAIRSYLAMNSADGIEAYGALVEGLGAAIQQLGILKAEDWNRFQGDPWTGNDGSGFR